MERRDIMDILAALAHTALVERAVEKGYVASKEEFNALPMSEKVKITKKIYASESEQ